MKNFKRLSLIAIFIITSVYFLGVNTPAVKAVTAEEIQAQIDALLAQLTQLQNELAELQGEEVAWCHDFHLNLKYGMAGTEVKALQRALHEEGFAPIPYKEGDKNYGNFEQYTASAVVGFQEEYTSEILASWGLKHGTGYVGSTTIAKLNQIYGCKVKPYIKVLAPNGGESYKVGDTITITWNALNIGTLGLYADLVDANGTTVAQSISGLGVGGPMLNLFSGSYSYKIPINIIPGKYKFLISTYGKSEQQAQDYSDNYFSIVEKVKALWDWEYCTSDSPCDAGEGDCDTDADCTTGYCAKDVGAKYGQTSSMDVCEEKEEERSITVLSPNGGETLVFDQPYTIKWSLSESLPTSDKINFTLLNASNNSKINLGGGLSQNYTSMTWGVSATNDIIPGNQYKIEVYDDQKLVNDKSDNYFSIVAPTTATTINRISGGTILQGQTLRAIGLYGYNLSGGSGSSCGVNFSSLDGLTINRCTAGFANIGIVVSVADNATPGERQITVTTPNGTSNAVTFTILSSSVTRNIVVTSPNGGEIWKTGETHRVTWTSQGIDKVAIYVYNDTVSGSGSTNYLDSAMTSLSVPAAQGYFDWTIVSGWLPKTTSGNEDRYKIRIDDVNVDTTGVRDLSDNYFSIVEALAEVTCTDSDGGKDYYVKGTVTDGGRSYTDYCQGAFYLKEYFCLPTSSTGSGGVAEEDVVCPNGGSCINGACTEEETSVTILSPNGGESYKVGDTITITWNALNIGTLGLYADLVDANGTTVAQSISGLGVGGPMLNLFSGSYSYKIPINIIPGKYKFLISTYGKSEQQAQDYSDNYFSIVEKKGDVVAYYKFDGNAIDYIGDNHGSIRGATSVKGISGLAYEFDAGDYISTSLSDSFTDELTFSVWVKPDSKSDERPTIIGFDDRGYLKSLWIDSSNRFVMEVPIGGARCSARFAMTYGQWYHVAGTANASTGEVKLYINGGLKTTTICNPGEIGTKSPLRIGYYGSVGKFKGIIDEVKIWNYALGVKEVMKEYSSMTGGGLGLKGIEKQLASIGNTISELMEKIKGLVGR